MVVISRLVFAIAYSTGGESPCNDFQNSLHPTKLVLDNKIIALYPKKR